MADSATGKWDDFVSKMAARQKHNRPAPIVIIQDRRSLGKILMNERKRRKKNLSKICESTGISRETIYRLERGENVSTGILFRYLLELGVSLKLDLPE